MQFVNKTGEADVPEDRPKGAEVMYDVYFVNIKYIYIYFHSPPGPV